MFFTTLKNTFVISATSILVGFPAPIILAMIINQIRSPKWKKTVQTTCLLYTSDAADDLLCVDLGGRGNNKKKKKQKTRAEEGNLCWEAEAK